MKRKMPVVTIIPLIFMGLAFIVSLCTNLTIGYAIFGPLLLWAVRLNFRRPDTFDGFALGVKAAFWPYILYLLISILTGHCVTCAGSHIGGLIIIPVLSGIGTFAFNFIPESEADKQKQDLTKNFGIKL